MTSHSTRIVYGLRPVEELLRSGREVALVYLAAAGDAERERRGAWKGIIEAAAQRKIAIEDRTREELDALTGGGVSPELGQTLALLGRAQSLARIRDHI